MLALLESEWQAAQATLDFVTSVGFNGNEEEDNYGEVRTIRFHYEEPNTGQRKEIEVPVLSLVPIPYLKVAEAEFDFGMNLSKSKHQSGGQMIDQFKGELSSSHTAKRKNLSVKVKLNQVRLPQGLQQMLRQVNGLYTTQNEPQIES